MNISGIYFYILSIENIILKQSMLYRKCNKRKLQYNEVIVKVKEFSLIKI
jgi:hypothetical protein